jgi:predicted Fe-Mo cluster-binding NifX family protein
MKIAISTNKDNLDGTIEERFSISQFLLILEIDDDTLSMKLNKSYEFNISETDLARIIIQEDCEAIISGILSTDAFNILALGGVTRFDGTGLSAAEAIERMHAYELNYFKNAENELEDSHNHIGSCEGHKH